MFSIEAFYREAHNGEKIDVGQFCDFLSSFEDLVIWGAGNLGTAVGKKIQDLGIRISGYWDAHFAQIKERNGIKVSVYNTGDFNKEKTLVLFCIANVPVSPVLYNKLHDDGWKNTLQGLAVLEGVLCPFSKDAPLDSAYCNSMDICTVCNCQRLSNIMKYKVSREKGIKEQDVLSFDRVHFIINNFCNLKCTHCFMYMNSYPSNRKRNVAFDVMKRDIKMVLEAVDSFGVINVFGGEPFLHPNLSDIVKEILSYDNYGSVIVNTNGQATMEDKQLEGFEDPRVRLAFSNYTAALGKEQVEHFEENVKKARAMGITVGVQNELPNWNVSSTLSDNKKSVDEMEQKAKKCGVRFLYVHNGKLYPCSMCLSINDLGVADYTTDYIDISKCKDAGELREKIKEMINRSYYQTCGHCDSNLPLTTIAGQQGFDERYALPKSGGEF